MSEEKNLKPAKTVYKSLCDMLDERKWHYERHDEDLTITCGVQGEDLPIELIIRVDAQRDLVSLLSPMSFAVPENRRAALAVAVSQANNGMIDGNFDYNYLNGKIAFRQTSSYRNSLISKELLWYMIACACNTIDNYNDKFLMVAKNNMTNEEILEFIK